MPSLRLVPGELQDAAAWEFVIAGERVTWDWTVGAPSVERLQPTRRVRSGALSRHSPVQAFCETTGTTMALESGLELELMLWLDRKRAVRHLVPQPVRLSWGRSRPHTPDLLSETATGEVTLWDARPTDRQDEDFLAATDATEGGCSEVGWAYQRFTGLPTTAGLNLRWLAGARRPPAWLGAHLRRLEELTGPGCSIGDVSVADGGSGYLLSSMWHLAWTGDIALDLDERWDDNTALSWGGAV